MKKKKKEEERNGNFLFDFLDCEEKLWDSGAIFDIRIAKGFHLHVYGFASLHCVYLGAAPIP